MKKLLALILAIALMASLSATVFAAESDESTITVVMNDAAGDGWDSFGIMSLFTDEFKPGNSSGEILEGMTNFFILADGTTGTQTYTVAKDKVVYFRWIDPNGESDENVSFEIYRDGVLQYSCDDVTQLDGSGSTLELFFTSYPTNNSKETIVTYEVAPTYTVTIPSDVTIGVNGTEATVSAEDVVVLKGKYVSVSLADNNNFTVTTREGAELDYTVTANGANVAAGGEILAVNPEYGKTGSAKIVFDIDESAIKYAGIYTGTATFTIAVKDVNNT